MKLTLTFVAFVATTSTALAHAGHVKEQSGHDHWLAICALAFAVWAAWSSKKSNTQDA